MKIEKLAIYRQPVDKLDRRCVLDYEDYEDYEEALMAGYSGQLQASNWLYEMRGAPAKLTWLTQAPGSNDH